MMEESTFMDEADDEHHGQLPVDDGKCDSEADSKKSTGRLCLHIKRQGLIWGVLAGLFQSVQVVLLAESAHAMNPLQTIFLRSIFLLVFTFSISWDEGVNYKWQDLFLNILYGLFDMTGIVFFLFATRFLPVSDVTVIAYNQPIPSTIAGCILLGEAFDGIDGALTIVNAIGLVLVSKTSVESHAVSTQGSPVTGVFLAFLALLFLVLLKLTGRKLAYKGRLDPSLVSCLVGFDGIMISSAYLTLTNSWEMPTTQTDILLSISLGIVAICQFHCLAKALQTENMMFIATALTLSIPITYCYDVIFKGIMFYLATFVGVILSIGSTLLLYVKTYLTIREEDEESHMTMRTNHEDGQSTQ